MAEENQEVQRAMDELRGSVQGLNAATKDATVGLDAFKKKAKELPLEIAKGLGNFTAQMARGDTSLKSMNAVVDVAANAISGLAKTVPYVGEALSAVAKGIAEGAKILVEQLDQTAKTFNAMSASGATVADGMTGLSRQFQTAGLSMQQFQKVVGQNAQALARFKGMAGDGAEEFSTIVGNLSKRQDTDLRKIGMSAEDIAGTTAAFVTQQTRLGKSQSMSTDQLTAGAKQYALELDQLSKVTGLSREAIQKQQDAALSESRFRASINSLNEQQQKDLLKLQTVMSSFGQELGQGTRDLVSGAANTDAARKLMADTGGAAQGIIARLKEGTIDTTQAQVEMRDAIKRGQEAQENVQKYTDGPYSNFANKAEFVAAKFDETGNLVKKTQTAQIKNTDKLTASTVEAQLNLDLMNVEFSKLAMEMMPAASAAIEEMTGAMVKMVKWANKQFGDGETTPEGKKEKETKAAYDKSMEGATWAQKWGIGRTKEQEEAFKAKYAAEQAATQARSRGPGAAAAEAKTTPAGPAPATTGTKGAPAGPAPAPAGPAPAPATTGPAPAGPAPAPAPAKTRSVGPTVDKSKETAPAAGGLFKGKSLDGINPGLVDALTQAVMAYGKPVTVTSAVRSLEDQQRLYNDYISGKSPYPAAKPGQSKHSTGNAVDIDSADANALAAGGFLAQFGLGRPVKGDPVHIQQISAANGAILSGPTSGYQPNLTMHGTEAIVPLNSPAAESMGVGGSENTNLMAAQLERLEEMVSVMKNQLSVSTKILQHAS